MRACAEPSSRFWHGDRVSFSGDGYGEDRSDRFRLQACKPAWPNGVPLTEPRGSMEESWANEPRGPWTRVGLMTQGSMEESWANVPRGSMEESWANEPGRSMEESWANEPGGSMEENWANEPGGSMEESWANEPGGSMEESWANEPGGSMEESWANEPGGSMEESWANEPGGPWKRVGLMSLGGPWVSRQVRLCAVSIGRLYKHPALKVRVEGELAELWYHASCLLAFHRIPVHSYG